MKKAGKLLIVDDNYIGRVILEKQLSDEYDVISAENGQQALELAAEHRKDLSAILLDLYMPVVDGFQALEKFKEMGITDEMPVFVISIENSGEKLSRAYDLGAADIIEKPFNPQVSLKRIRSTVELYANRAELKKIVDMQQSTINRQSREMYGQSMNLSAHLASLIEFRGTEDSGHADRVKSLTEKMLNSYASKHPDAELDEHTIELISEASVYHDIGKISVPDSILLKNDYLTEDELETVRTHAAKGCEILKSVRELEDTELYRYCYDICRWHHERVDGRGYPDRISGERIPLWSHIVGIAEVYDALVSRRSYRPAFSHERAIEMIMNGECGAFRNDVLVVFVELSDEIKMMYRD